MDFPFKGYSFLINILERKKNIAFNSSQSKCVSILELEKLQSKLVPSMEYYI